MGDFVGKQPCEKCGSRDNLVVWTDGYQCKTPGCDNRGKIKGDMELQPIAPKVSKLRMEGTIRAIPDRRISEETCKKMGITVTYDSAGKIDKHFYPYYNKLTKELTACKMRVCATKDMPWSGNRKDIGLFNQQNCRGHGKYITITEGEIDCAAVDEMFDNKWDVVSLKNGADGAEADIRSELDFLSGYDNIILCFDMDEAGAKAVNAVKDLLPPGKVKIVSLPSKDAGAMLQAAKVRDFTKAWWDAEPYRPDGIIQAKDTLKEVLRYKNTPSVPYPWKGLNDITLGMRKQEIVVWAADTGVGKSQTMREIQDHIIKTTQDNVGCLMLEESIGKTMMGWMSFHAGRPLHKELDKLTDEEVQAYWEAVAQDNRYVLLDHRGWQNDIDKLVSRIRYMKHTFGCEWIVLDHLHIALSSIAGASGDWSGIDELMTNFRSLVHELDVGLHLVSHTSGERNLRGSKGISKIADAVIFLERDKHNPDPVLANTTAVVVDKNRWAGDVGTACYLLYDKFTGRMLETSAPTSMVAEF